MRLRKKIDLPYVIMEMLKDVGWVSGKEMWDEIVKQQLNINTKTDSVMFDHAYFSERLYTLKHDGFIDFNPGTDRYKWVKVLPDRHLKPQFAKPPKEKAVVTPIGHKEVIATETPAAIAPPPDVLLEIAQAPSGNLTGEMVICDDKIEAKPSLGFGADIDDQRDLVTIWQREEDRRKRPNQIVLTAHHMDQLVAWWGSRSRIAG